MSPRIQRFLKYSGVGFGTFLLDLLLLTLLVEWGGVSQTVAAGLAFFLAVSLNYFISRKYVFRGTLRKAGEGYVNFILIALLGVGIVTGGMHVLTVVLNLNYLLARVLVAAVTGFWNYLINLYVNFKLAGKY